jgi:hypothetical protein
VKKASYIAVLAIIAAFAMALAGAGSAAGPAPDLSSTSAINAYLTSIGVDPSTAVWENGSKNYAGPNCPGRGWTCTKASVVVQVTPANGTNTCTPTASSGRFVCVQSGQGQNMANCFESASGATSTQDCLITQTGVQNTAIVNQSVSSSGSPQSATQTAEVTQTAQGGDNQVNLHQMTKQTTNAGDTQSEDAHQAATVIQGASGSGNNTSQVHQKQKQTESGAATTQTQNTLGLSGGLTDCYDSGFEPTTPNACANVSQASDAGMNDSHLDQAIDQGETSTASANQQQNSSTAGLDGRVHQETTSGTSLDHAVQRKQQQMRSNGGIQLQFDPLFCCGAGSQDGGTNNHENIDQSAAQSASGGSLTQSVTILGMSKTEGACSVGQHARINGAMSSIQASNPPPCGTLVVETGCTSASEEEPADCTPSFPFLCGINIICECVEICFDSPTVETLSSTPTYGQPLDPLDLSDQALSSG